MTATSDRAKYGRRVTTEGRQPRIISQSETNRRRALYRRVVECGNFVYRRSLGTNWMS